MPGADAGGIYQRPDVDHLPMTLLVPSHDPAGDLVSALRPTELSRRLVHRGQANAAWPLVLPESDGVAQSLKDRVLWNQIE